MDRRQLIDLELTFQAMAQQRTNGWLVLSDAERLAHRELDAAINETIARLGLTDEQVAAAAEHVRREFVDKQKHHP